MPITIGAASGNRDLSEVWVGTSGGNKQVQEVWVGTASGNKQVFSAASPMSVNAEPDSQQWETFYNYDPKTGEPTSVAGYSASLTCSVTGGQAPFAYLWQQLSGPTNSFDTPTASATFVSGGGSPSTFRVRVTDDLGTVAYSDAVTIAGYF
jgi:hypothetical protein